MDLNVATATARYPPATPTAPTKNYYFKCVTVGHPSVGKTCLVNRLASGKFIDSPITTFNADSVKLSVPLSSRSSGGENASVTVDLWDTAGQERYRSLTLSYFRDARAVLVTYDEENVLTVGDWLKELQRFVGGGGGGGAGMNDSDALVFLIGTKLDLGPGVKLSRNKVRELGARHEIEIAGHFALSAKTGEGLTEALEGVVEAVVSAGENGRLDLSQRRGTIRPTKGKGRPGSKQGEASSESGWCCW